MYIPVTNEMFQEEARSEEEAKRMLVMANRIMANEGLFDAYGHVSVRNPADSQTFFISRALAPELVTIRDIVEMNLDGQIVRGEPGFKPFGESVIHCAIYKARTDVMCIAHPHPSEIIPFASADIPLKSIYHMNVTFYDGIPLFEDFSPENVLLVNNMETAEKLAAVLKDHRGVLIRNHGVVVVGESIPRALYSTVTLRDNAKMLLYALSTGGRIRYLSEEEMKEAMKDRFQKALSRSWELWCDRIKRDCGKDLWDQ